MSGVVGVDIQQSRTAIALVEIADGTLYTASVGDGHRILVPNASAGALWGSEAALRHLADVSNSDKPADHLTSWLRDGPWTAGFFGGLYARLTTYLGQTPPTHTYGYELVFSVSPPAQATPGTPGQPEPAALLELCEGSGLSAPLSIAPTDALLVRWLSQSSGSGGPSPVVVVACGETWTSVACYQRADRDDHVPTYKRVGGPVHVPSGGGAVTEVVAREVLSRCGEGVRPTALLGLVDGVCEFAAMLRARRDSDTDLRYNGALADRMHHSYRLSRRHLSGVSGAGPLTRECAAAVRRVASSAGGAVASHPTIVVGGPGSVWPFLPDALALDGTVWQSDQPELDLAVGAALWPVLRRLVSGSPALAAPVRSAVAGAEPVRQESRQAAPDPYPAAAVEVDMPDEAPNELVRDILRASQQTEPPRRDR